MRCVLVIVFTIFLAHSNALDCGENGRVLACPCTRTCDNPEGPHFCPCNEGCSCNGGYLLDETINKCVLPEKCPKSHLLKNVEEEKTTYLPSEDQKSTIDLDPLHLFDPFTSVFDGEEKLFKDMSDMISKDFSSLDNTFFSDVFSEDSSSSAPTTTSTTSVRSQEMSTTVSKDLSESNTASAGEIKDSSSIMVVYPANSGKEKEENSTTSQNISSVSSNNLTSTSSFSLDKLNSTDSSLDNLSSTASSYPRLSDGSCGMHSHLEKCPCNKTCANPDGLDLCECTPGCACDDGFLFDEIIGKCVPSFECKKMNVEIVTSCGKNAHIEMCPCKKTCANPTPLDCENCEKKGCTCDFGYVLDEDINECIRESQCKNQTGGGLPIFNMFGFDDEFLLTEPDDVLSQSVHAEVETNPLPSSTLPTTTIDPSKQNYSDFIYIPSQSSNSKVEDGVLIIINDSEPSSSQCEEHAHYAPCQCERFCSKAERTRDCPCVNRCKCLEGFLRHDLTGKCVRPEECPQYDDIKAQTIVYKKSFLSWCFSPDEPMHIFFSLLFVCIVIGLIFSLCSTKKRIPVHSKIINQ